jgi:3-dehydroquinate synthase
MLLNFGHTLGHAYEKACGYGIYTHGEAVAAGMCRITDWSEKAGLTEKGTFLRLRNLVESYGLPCEISADHEDIEEALGLDKKGEGDRLKLVLLEGIGKAFLHQTTKKEFVKELES